MPRLPTLDDLGSRPIPVSQRSVASNPYAGAVGEAVGNIGDAASKAGEVLFERQDKLQYAAAKTALLKADVTARQELQDDPDYETWGARYNDKMKAAREAAVGMIGNHSDRKLFESDAELDTMRGNAELSGLANGRRHQARVGTLDQSLIDLQDTGQNAPDDATREAVIGNAHTMIEAAVGSGDITAADGVERKRRWTQSYVGQRIESLKTQGDLDAATSYLNAHRSALDPEAETRFDAQLRDATENRQNYTVADDIMAGINKPSAAADPYSKYALVTNPDKSTWDKRADGSEKGTGWLGLRQRPDGGVSSEISVGVEIHGKEQDIPLMVPGLTKTELDYLMTHDPDQEKNPNFIKDMPRSIMQKAEAFAKQRIGQGLSPFKQANEPDYAPPSAAHVPATATSVSQMLSITAHTESGNRERVGGQLVTSPKGAQGMMQVMPATAANPGYGIRPWDGKTDADRSRVGRELLGALLQKYNGDAAKAWAAYNWDSSGTKVDRAVAKYGNDWLDHTPAETRAYVRKNVAALGGNTAAPGGKGEQLPDLGTINANIDARAKAEGWAPERREKVRSLVMARVNQQDAVIKQHQDDAFNSALAKSDALGNSFTDPSQLGDAFYKASETDQHRLRAIADANLKANAAATGPKANGDEIRSLKNMAVGTVDDQAKFAGLNLAQYRAFMTPSEYEEITVKQTQTKSTVAKGPNAWNPASGISQAINWGKNFQGVEVKDGEDKYRVYNYMDARSREWSAQNGGKAPTDNEYQQFFREATREEHVPGLLYGTNTVKSYKVMGSRYKVLIINRLHAAGIANPTDAQIHDLYERMGKPGEAE